MMVENYKTGDGFVFPQLDIHHRDVDRRKPPTRQPLETR